VVLGEAAESSISFLTALDTATLAVEDLLNAITKLLRPVDVLLFRIFIVERADTIRS
jgi:hypothetical protein